jgi:hypothetical protein
MLTMSRRVTLAVPRRATSVTSALCSCLPIMLTQRLSWVMWSLCIVE